MSKKVKPEVKPNANDRIEALRSKIETTKRQLELAEFEARIQDAATLKMYRAFKAARNRADKLEITLTKLGVFE